MGVIYLNYNFELITDLNIIKNVTTSSIKYVKEFLYIYISFRYNYKMFKFTSVIPVPFVLEKMERISIWREWNSNIYVLIQDFTFKWGF